MHFYILDQLSDIQCRKVLTRGPSMQKAKLNVVAMILSVLIILVALSNHTMAQVSDTEYNTIKDVDSITASLKTATSDTMLSIQKRDPLLRSLVAFLRVKVNRKEYTDIAEIIDKLRIGNKPGTDVCTFIDEKKKDPMGHEYYSNARNLGYFMASLVVAISREAPSKAERTLNS